MPDIDMSPEDIAEIFGGEVTESIMVDEEEIQVVLALADIRDRLLAAMQRDGVDVARLAKRLSVSPASVSRFLYGDADVRLSTLVLYARALGLKWDFALVPDPSCVKPKGLTSDILESAATSGIVRIVARC